MITVGLIGELPNDTESIKNLLLKKYSSVKINFITLLNGLNGSKLDTQKTKRNLRREYETLKPNIIIFIRDLDGLKSNKHQNQLRKQYFTDFNSVVNKNGIYLLNIYEIEALILADISIFNSEYNTEIKPFQDVMEIEEPKELLKKATKGKYVESHNSKIFDQLNFQEVLTCAYFKDFVEAFDELLS